MAFSTRVEPARRQAGNPCPPEKAGFLNPTLIYDADCNLCVFSKEMIERWDRRRAVRFLHYEDPVAFRLQPDLVGAEHLDAFRFIDREGRAWKGPEAAVHLLRTLPLGRPLAWMLTVPGAYGIAERFYAWVARNRYRWFGRTSP